MVEWLIGNWPFPIGYRYLACISLIRKLAVLRFIRHLPARLRLPAGKHGGILTYLQTTVKKKRQKIGYRGLVDLLIGGGGGTWASKTGGEKCEKSVIFSKNGLKIE